MVAKALKECRVCSCHELTNNSNGYCDKHIAIGKRVRNIDKYDKFYNTKVWDNKRLSIYNRDYGMCLRCNANGQTVDAVIVHHIIEIKSKTTPGNNLNNRKAKECTDPKIKEILISYCNERIEKLQPKG